MNRFSVVSIAASSTLSACHMAFAQSPVNPSGYIDLSVSNTTSGDRVIATRKSDEFFITVFKQQGEVDPTSATNDLMPRRIERTSAFAQAGVNGVSRARFSLACAWESYLLRAALHVVSPTCSMDRMPGGPSEDK